MPRKRRRNRFKFTEKKQSKKGIAAFSLAAVCEIFYGVFVYYSYKENGNLSMYFGSAGILIFAVAFVAFVLSMRSLFEEDSFKTFPRLAIIMSLIALLSWGGTYVRGFLL